AAFDADLDRMTALANDLGHPRLVWRARLLGSMRACARGRFDESERLIADVERYAQLTDDPSLGPSLGAHRFPRQLDLHDIALPPDPRVDAGFAQLPLGAVLRRIFGASVCARIGATARVATELAGFGLDEYLAVGRSSSGVGVLADIYAVAGTPAQQRMLRDRLAAFGDRV